MSEWGWLEGWEGLDISQLTQTMSPGLNRLLVFLCKILEQKLPTLAIIKIRLLFSLEEGDVGDCEGRRVVLKVVSERLAEGAS